MEFPHGGAADGDPFNKHITASVGLYKTGAQKIALAEAALADRDICSTIFTQPLPGCF